jgi:hypothetical protein
MKQTAIEWLNEQLQGMDSKSFNNLIQIEIGRDNYKDIIEQAKAMEKEQQQETFKQSRLAKIFEKDMPPIWENFEQYYNETFKQD